MTGTDRQPGGPLAWLELVRLPTVFTALADILLGVILVDDRLPQEKTAYLLAASAGLYLSGMVFNDIFDRHTDAADRPGRPLPSGRVSLRGAIGLGTVLMGLGIAAAAVTGSAGQVIGPILAISVLAYDAGLKRTFLGPLAMGACRFLNVLLGASIVGPLESVTTPDTLQVAGGLGVYIVGVTWFGRREASTSSRVQLVGALLVINTGLGTLVAFAARVAAQNLTSVTLLLALILVTINRRLIVAVRDPRANHVQSAMRTLLLSLVMIDAALVLAYSGQTEPALITAALIVPAVVLRKWVPMT